MNPLEALAHLITAPFRSTPRRPKGVRARIGDRWIEPADMSYVGKSASGQHEWVARFDVCVDHIDDLHIDLMPGKTSLALAFLIGPEDSP